MTHKFDLSHLTQEKDERVMGPIQDSDALLLYALVKVTMTRRIVEVGGLKGYSAQNFLKAMDDQGILFTIDVKDIPRMAENHITIKSPADNVNPTTFGKEPIDLVFFDCHQAAQQMNLLNKMEQNGLIHEGTILALHDTNGHPTKLVPWAYENTKGEWVHQTAERSMVNILNLKGWQAICLHTQPERHSKNMPFRHGLTLMKKFSKLCTTPK